MTAPRYSSEDGVGCPVGGGYDCQSRDKIDAIYQLCKENRDDNRKLFSILNGNGTPGAMTRLALVEERIATGKDNSRWLVSAVFALISAGAAVVAVWR